MANNRFLSCSLGLVLASIFTSGCRKDRGLGAYLLVSEGRSPGKDVVYELDTRSRKLTTICGNGPRMSIPCARASSSLDRSVAVYITGDGTKYLPPVASTRITLHGQQIGIFPTVECPSCSPMDSSVSPDGRLVVLTVYSTALTASSIWTFNISHRTWHQMTEWLRSPSFVARPLIDESGGSIFSLYVSKGSSGLESSLKRIDLASGKSYILFDGKTVAAFALGPSGNIVALTQKGFEILEKGRESMVVAQKAIMRPSEEVRPTGITWNVREQIIALAVWDKSRLTTRVIEFDPVTRKTTTVFDDVLGGRVSIQSLHR